MKDGAKAKLKEPAEELIDRFTEMSTSRFVESAFWNFDSMFVPQQHPAREVQDTFYVKSESSSPLWTRHKVRW